MGNIRDANDDLRFPFMISTKSLLIAQLYHCIKEIFKCFLRLLLAIHNLLLDLKLVLESANMGQESIASPHTPSLVADDYFV